MNKKIKTDAVDSLFQAILALENKDECYAFLRIYVRLTNFYRFLSVMKLPVCYAKKDLFGNCRKTGASTATISRVNRSLNYGSDGYELVFNRIPNNQNEV